MPLEPADCAGAGITRIYETGFYSLDGVHYLSHRIPINTVIVLGLPRLFARRVPCVLLPGVNCVPGCLAPEGTQESRLLSSLKEESDQSTMLLMAF